ncbi:MAG: RNase P subunit p30 family protein [Pyrodictiaceae archaeon]
MKAIDLCVKPRSIEDFKGIAETAIRLGYKALVIETDDPSKFREAGKEMGIKVLARTTIRPHSKTDLLRALQTIKGYDVIAVESKSAEVIRHAARDSRVDVIVLAPTMSRYMDRSEARLLRQGGGLIEFWLSRLLTTSGPRPWRRLRSLMIIARRALAYQASLAVSSCARSLWELWHPRSIVSLLVTLGIPEVHAKTIVYVNPLKLVSSKGISL